ncbi:MAG TPA: hypothetical protein VG325_19450 [Solirubrobacteraceae bacterium]|nr:hypothetical protein [Solirubrobacteraceae bacterium]
MSHPHPALSPQGEKVVICGFSAGILAFLALGFGVLGAPVPIALVPFVLAVGLVTAVHADVHHVRRHGWHGGPEGPTGHGPCEDPPEPTPPGPSGDELVVDWDSFVAQFWDHVERPDHVERQPARLGS